ncbi:hypothetical protein FVEN_g276 [Fusarium venenatum]|uniref:Ig-like domain-containing protein n=1 Tax=Fusarium venenatum TaxID=56646 RepID=A0A2L2TT47_9HYPO|nr:uncharacterized protein FVRRES_07621 [Fusarium venenatum]KAG8361829.1 hypothetical protein FVEN_g276 [Fusarium venenatum]KAH6994520.1 hypothetical protein EDB82DRAFT_525597 [Fusarium venenatum]CEI63185.1 unnamed protein product [Fusarium venenatum]
MRSLVLRLALGLFAARAAVASPCKPSLVTTTSKDISIVSTEISSVTSAASSTISVSTTSVITEPSTKTYASSSLEAPSLATTETSATTTFVTELSTVESTTTASTTTTPSTTESTVMSAFTIIATGESDLEGDSLHTSDHDGYVAVFHPNPIFGVTSARPYTIDSQRRLVNDQGYFLCAYYNANNVELDAPAQVNTCTSNGPKNPFLDCELTSDLTLRCGIPGWSCVFNPNGEPICEEDGSTWGTWSTGIVIVGRGLKIGPIDTPDRYNLIGLRASMK